MNSENHYELHLQIALPAELLILFNIAKGERIPLEFEIIKIMRSKVRMFSYVVILGNEAYI
jgi:hypothetical protein